MASMMLSCIGIALGMIGFGWIPCRSFQWTQVIMDQAHELPDSDLALTWLISKFFNQILKTFPGSKGIT